MKSSRSKKWLAGIELSLLDFDRFSSSLIDTWSMRICDWVSTAAIIERRSIHIATAILHLIKNDTCHRQQRVPTLTGVSDRPFVQIHAITKWHLPVATENRWADPPLDELIFFMLFDNQWKKHRKEICSVLSWANPFPSDYEKTWMNHLGFTPFVIISVSRSKRIQKGNEKDKAWKPGIFRSKKKNNNLDSWLIVRSLVNKTVENCHEKCWSNRSNIVSVRWSI